MTKLLLLIAFICYNPFNWADWIINLAWIAFTVDVICGLVILARR